MNHKIGCLKQFVLKVHNQKHSSLEMCEFLSYKRNVCLCKVSEITGGNPNSKLLAEHLLIRKWFLSEHSRAFALAGLSLSLSTYVDEQQ